MTNQPHFHVLVTRPKPQGEALCQHLQAEGFDTVYLPAIEIQLLPDLSLLRQQIAQLDQYAWAIFVSRSAVLTSQAIHEQWPQLPPNLQIAAIGEGTAAALKQAGIVVNLYPPAEWSSEGLLSLPALQNLAGKKVAVFCGVGGRELLVNRLQERGAEVIRFISYQRCLPQIDMVPYRERLDQGQLDAMICTSFEGLANVQQLFGQPTWLKLRKIPLVLISERIMIQAKDFGFENCFLAKNASHEGITQALRMIRNKR